MDVNGVYNQEWIGRRTWKKYNPLLNPRKPVDRKLNDQEVRIMDAAQPFYK